MNRIAKPAILIVAALAMVLGPPAMAQDEWVFGIGTGFFGLNIDGNEGFGTKLGPLELDASLDSDEVRELLESAFGLGGFAAKGKWVIGFSGSQLELKETLDGKGPLGTSVDAEASFTGTGAELTGAYRFAVTGKHAWSVLVGARYTKHEYEFGLDVGSASLSRSFDHDWTDALIGLTHAVPLSEKWTWRNRLDAGFGGSEGTYFINTSFNWQVAKHFALGFFGQNMSVDFENGEEGDSDWYFYDANEFGAGVNLLFTF